MSQDEYITTDQACSMLGISRSTLAYYVKQGRIKKYTRGITRNVFYSRSEIERLAEIRPAEGGDQDEE